MIKRRSFLKSSVAAAAIALTSSAALCQSFFYNPAIFFPERILFVQADQTMFGAPVQPVAYNGQGHSTPATNTVWFGAIPDRLNMLTPNSGGATTGGSLGLPTGATSIPPAHYGNLWTLNAATLGSTTAAPDGSTANSQAVVEDTSNGQHYLSAAVMNFSSLQATGPLRFAAILKYSGRRVVMQFANPNDSLYVVFDLLNAQIGVSATKTNSGNTIFTILNSGTIQSLGGGWYKCFFDFSAEFVGGFSNLNAATIMLDNGTGTAALSNSYTGNGTSGCFVWRTNLMPVQSYAMNNVTFFDDFNNLSTIDVNNTQAPGFNWYVRNYFTPFETDINSGPSSFSVNSSVLTILSNVDNLTAFTMGTITQIGTAPTGTIIGRSFHLPYLFEWKVAVRVDQNIINDTGLDMWGLAYEWLVANAGANPLAVPNGKELDYGELGPNGENAFNMLSGFDTGPSGGGSIVQAHAGMEGGTPPYYPKQLYSSGPTVNVGGVRYLSINNIPLNTPPPNPTYWSVVSYPGGGNPNLPNNAVFDKSTMHTYSYLVLPYYGSSTNSPGSPEQVGTYWGFIDGLCFNLASSYAPRLSGFSYMQTVDSLSMPIFIGACHTGGAPLQIDYVKVMQ